MVKKELVTPVLHLRYRMQLTSTPSIHLRYQPEITDIYSVLISREMKDISTSQLITRAEIKVYGDLKL